jgi:hypothetical protein
MMEFSFLKKKIFLSLVFYFVLKVPIFHPLFLFLFYLPSIPS